MSTLNFARRPLFSLAPIALAAIAGSALAADPVGFTQGELSVDPTGAANYKIDIAVPGGVAGMQPELAFIYSSRAGNGQLGVGWSLSGLSAISRCPKTKATDGGAYIDGVDYDLEDRLCLDGQRLMIAGANTDTAYWAATSFGTEIASFQRVTAIGPNGALGHASFVVEDKAGLKRFYGNTADSRIEKKGVANPTPAMTWAVSRIEDRSGNYIEFHYGESAGGEYWPSEISWLSKNGFQAGKTVFDYSTDRVDSVHGFVVGGGVTETTHRLSKVRVYARSTFVRSYELSYTQHNSSKVSQLTSLRECAGNGDCLRPTTFKWDEGVAGFMSTGSDVYNGMQYDLRMGDFDGDGRIDQMHRNTDHQHIHIWYGGDDVQLVDTFVNTHPQYGGINLSAAVVLDYDGDGDSDLLVPKWTGGLPPTFSTKWTLVRSNGRTMAPDGEVALVLGNQLGGEDLKKPAPMPVDLDGDGLPELVLRDVSNNHLVYFKNSPTGLADQPVDTGFLIDNQSRFHPFDHNGDGRTDLLITDIGASCGCPSGMGVLLNMDGQNFQHLATNLPAGTGDRRESLQIVDVNGDGLSDVLAVEDTVYGPNKWFLYTNTGTYLYQRAELQLSLLHDKAAQVLDYDGDGKTDLMFGKVISTGQYGIPTSHWVVALSNGVNFGTDAQLVDTGISDGGDDRRESTQLVDINGDGKSDIFEVASDEADVWVTFWGRKAYNGLLTSITNGVGDKTDIAYWSLSQPLIGASNDPYTELYEGPVSDDPVPHALPAPEYHDFLGPIMVVSDFWADSGVRFGGGEQGRVHTEYHYAGAKMNNYGRGFAGFRRLYAINSNGGIYTVNYHRQDFPYTGMVEYAEQRTAIQMVYTEEDPTETTLQCEGPFGQPVEPDGCPERHLRPRRSPSGIDRYISKTLNTHDSVDLAQLDFSKVAPDYQYPDAQVGVYPFVKTTKVEHFDPNEGTITKLKSEETTFTYDVCGNATSIFAKTVDGSGGQEHTTTTTNTYDDAVLLRCFGRLLSSTVSNKRAIYNSDNAAPQEPAARRTEFVYDSGTQYLVDEKIISNDGLWLTKHYGYDTYGNRTSELVTGQGLGSGRGTSTTFDANGQYVVGVQNALGQREARTWDYRYGVQTSVTGPNGLTTQWQYDGFGRKQAEIAPRTSVNTTWTYEWCGAGVACAHGSAVYRVIAAGSDGSSNVSEIDVLGRTVLTSKIGIGPGPNTPSQPYAEIRTETHYDPFGRPSVVSLPYFVGATNRCWLVRGYDVLGRVTTEQSPGAESECVGNSVPDPTSPPLYSKVTTTAYDGFTTTVTDPKGRAVSRDANVMGRTRFVRESGIQTEYDYDAFGNTTWVKAPGSTPIRLGYNDRGFKVSMQDPDMGSWSYSYNALGELVGQTDGNQLPVSLAYDALGRLVQRTEPEGQTSWVYDTAYGRGIGKPAYVIGANGYVEAYAYDEFGAATDTMRVIDGELFWVSQTYDNLGRPDVTVYPDIQKFNTNSTPVAPAFISPPPTSNGTHTLNWNETSDYAVYRLYRAKGATATSGEATEMFTSPRASADDRVTIDDTYRYWVKACHGTLCSAFSAPASIVVTTPPATPAWLTVPDYDHGNDGVYEIKWAATDKAGSTYELEETSGPSFGGAILAYTGGLTSWVLDPARDTGTYNYRVRACIAASCSGWQLADAATLVERTPAAPATVTLPARSETTTFVANWAASPHASRYDVYFNQRVPGESCGALPTTLAGSTSGTSLSITVPWNGLYCVRVRACMVTGYVSGGELCSGTTFASNPEHTGVGPTPGPITGFAAPVSSTTGLFTLNWNDRADVAGFKVERASDPGFTQGLVSASFDVDIICTQTGWNNDVPPEEICLHSHQNSDFSPGWLGNGTYYFRVFACNTWACSDPTTAMSVVVTLPPAETGAISVPSGYDIDGSFDVLWGASASASTSGAFTHYELMESNDGGADTAPWAAIAPSPSTAQKQVTGKANGVYWYRVRACNAAACSTWTYSASGVQVVTPPAAPAMIAVPATSATGSYTVEWLASTTSNLHEYRLWEASNSGFTDAVQIPVGQTEVCDHYITNQEGEQYCNQSHVELNLYGDVIGRANGSYWYRVQACRLGVCSAYTGGSSTTISVLLPPAAPNAPTPSSTFTTTGAYNVTWTAPAGPVTSYTLYENGASVSTSAVSPYAFSGKANGSYSYKVAACNGSGCGPQSAVSASVLVELAPGLPGVPGTTPNPINSGNFTVSWSAASGTVTSYELYESTSSGTLGTLVHTGAAASKALTGRSNNVTYWYQVRACNGGTCGDYRQGSIEVRLAPSTPAAPTVNPTQSTNGSYTVSWTAPAGTPTYYVLQYATDTGFTTGVTNETLSASPKNVTGAVDGHRYYRVQACNTVANACSAFGAYSDAYTTLVPGVAGTPTFSPSPSTNGSYTVSWTAPSTGTVTTYQLDEATNSGFTAGLTTSSVATLSKAISGKANGTYFYRVRACNTTSACAANSSGTPSILVSLPPSVPGTPTSSASPSLDGAYTVSWTASTGNVTHYVLEASTASNFGTIASTYQPATNSQAVSGMPDGLRYYRVRSCNTAASCSANSASLSVNTTLPPGAPASFTIPASPDVDGAYTLNWGAGSGTVSNYELYESTSSSFATQTLIYSPTGLSQAVTGRASGTYYYRARACRTSVGCSGYTAGSGGVTVALTPGTPGANSVSPNPSTNGNYTVSWGGSTGTVTTYEVQEGTSSSFTSPTLVYSGTNLSWAASGKGNGALYYRVRACNTASACSAYNAYIIASVTLPPSTPATTTAPATNNTGAYTVSWTTATGTMTSYEVYESNSSSFSSQWLVYSGGVATSVNLTSRGTGTYYYRTRACYDTACSGYSSTATTVVSNGPVAPGIPSSISASPVESTDGIFTVTWGASTGTVTAYELQEQVDDNTFPSPTLRYTGTNTSKGFTKGVFARTYYYRVRACNGTSCSAYRGIAESTVYNDASVGPQKPEIVPEVEAERVAQAAPSDTTRVMLIATAADDSVRYASRLGAKRPAIGAKGKKRSVQGWSDIPGASAIAATDPLRFDEAALRAPQPLKPLRDDPFVIAGYMKHGGTMPAKAMKAAFGSAPTGVYAHKVQQVYSPYGHLVATRECIVSGDVCNPNAGTTYWRVEQADSAGRIIKDRLGNDVVTLRGYDEATGTLLDVEAGYAPVGSSFAPGVEDLHFTWDEVGNLMARADNTPGQVARSETFTYDSMYRMVGSQETVAGVVQPLKSYGYDVSGNITNLANTATNYEYASGRPHAVTSVTVGGAVRSYSYDGNGNMALMTEGGVTKRQICWQSSNHPTLIAAGVITDCATGSVASGAWSQFAYTPDRARFKQVSGTGATTSKTVLYVGSLFEKETTAGGSTVYTHYIRGAGRVAAVFTRTVNAQNQTQDTTEYWHRDHLDSVIAKTDQSGAVTWRGRFDAWGNPLAGTANGRRGFTGHEHLEALGLIHMNGRVYDPVIGRFLSPDTFVQFPDSTQGFNRYTYVGNNPLSYNDPSGHFSLKKLLPVISIAVSFIPGINVIAAGAISGFIGSGGDLKAGILGAVGAGLAFGIGHGIPAFANAPIGSGAWFGKALAHGVAQGAVSAAGGGRFGDGFLGGAAGSLTGPLTERLVGKGFAQTMAAAMVGGTVSVIGGGKFANGAISAFLVSRFNDNGAQDAQEAEVEEALRQERREKVLQQKFDIVEEAGAYEGTPYAPDPAKHPGAKYSEYAGGNAERGAGADCSGSVHDIYARAGIKYPYATTAALSADASKFGFVPVTSAEPGDIILYKGHMSIYKGGGNFDTYTARDIGKTFGVGSTKQGAYTILRHKSLFID